MHTLVKSVRSERPADAKVRLSCPTWASSNLGAQLFHRILRLGVGAADGAHFEVKVGAIWCAEVAGVRHEVARSDPLPIAYHDLRYVSEHDVAIGRPDSKHVRPIRVAQTAKNDPTGDRCGNWGTRGHRDVHTVVEPLAAGAARVGWVVRRAVAPVVDSDVANLREPWRRDIDDGADQWWLLVPGEH